jgi:hypothetical protein
MICSEANLTMDIPAAIDLNKSVLLRIVAGLLDLLGAAQARIPLALHRTIVRVLRPAESAARRLIVTLARITKPKAPPRRSRPAPTGLVRAARASRRLAFPLFDPRQRFGRRRPAARGPAPRISSLAPGAGRAPLIGSRKVRDLSDGLETSANILARLAALKGALEDLPRQARRLVRALERRRHNPRLKFKMPLRRGRAPGFRKKPRLDIDGVLHQCDWLARNALAPDTS